MMMNYLENQHEHYGSIVAVVRQQQDDDHHPQDQQPPPTRPPATTRARGLLLIPLALFLLALVVFGLSISEGEDGAVFSTYPSAQIFASSSGHHHDDHHDRHHDHHNDYDGTRALFYDDQLVDHFRGEDDTGEKDNELKTWSNRYYLSTKHYEGPGHPVFLVVGGEGAIDTGMLYPFVTEKLAKRFGAAVVQIEHRFYGPYQPVANATNRQLVQLLTPHQAMADMVRLTRHLKEDILGCSSTDRSSDEYCPVVSVGASYPGFLSAMFRLVYPDFVDISYASSAPLLMYAQAVDQDAYYDIVTDAAERASPGCPDAVLRTTTAIQNEVRAAPSVEEAARRIGFCPDKIPPYIRTQDMLSDAAIMLASFSFAEYNSEAYPPGPNTTLARACQLFQDASVSDVDTMVSFLDGVVTDPTKKRNAGECFDLRSQLPDGPHSTLEDTAGDYDDGRMWDFQLCTQIVFLAGFSNGSSLFPPQEQTYEHLARHCHDRFGVTPRPYELVDEWGFDDLGGATDASYILFVNGLQDMWAGGSYLHNVSDTIVAVNLENGAHHSDLTHKRLSEQRDTDDVREGHRFIENILAEWLEDIRGR